MKILIFLLLTLQLFAQREVLWGNTKSGIEADNKFKYYAVVLGKKVGENLTEFTTDWKWVFAIALNKYLANSLDSLLESSRVRSLNSQENASYLKLLKTPDKLRSELRENQEVIYLKKLKILYEPKKEMLTVSNKFKVIFSEAFRFEYSLLYLSKENFREDSGEFYWIAGEQPGWEELLLRKIIGN